MNHSSPCGGWWGTFMGLSRLTWTIRVAVPITCRRDPEETPPWPVLTVWVGNNVCSYTAKPVRKFFFFSFMVVLCFKLQPGPGCLEGLWSLHPWSQGPTGCAAGQVPWVTLCVQDLQRGLPTSVMQLWGLLSLTSPSL